MANIPAVITCTDVMAEKHPELVVAFMKEMIKVGRWANEHKRAAAASSTSRRSTGRRGHVPGYQGRRHGAQPLAQNLASIEIGKDFMLSHGYIKHDFDVQKWAAPEFLEQAAKELSKQQWKKATAAKLPAASELQASSADRVVGRKRNRKPVAAAPGHREGKK